MKTESVPHPKWLHTYMFAHRVVSWTMEQSSCIFNMTIAGFPVLDSAIGDGFSTCRNVVCQHSVMAEITVKQRAFAFIVFDFQNWETRLRSRRRYFRAVNMRQNVIAPRAGIMPDCDHPATKLCQHTQNIASVPSHHIQPPTAGASTHMTPVGLVMAGCWQISSILTNIGRRNSTRILNQHPFFWNIFIWKQSFWILKI